MLPDRADNTRREKAYEKLAYLALILFVWSCIIVFFFLLAKIFPCSAEEEKIIRHFSYILFIVRVLICKNKVIDHNI